MGRRRSNVSIEVERQEQAERSFTLRFNIPCLLGFVNKMMEYSHSIFILYFSIKKQSEIEKNIQFLNESVKSIDSYFSLWYHEAEKRRDRTNCFSL